MSVSPTNTTLSRFEDGLRAFEARRFDDALRILSETVTADPAQIEARHVLALVQRAIGMLGTSVENLAEVIRCQPKNAEAWSNYGAVLRESGRLDEAYEALHASLELDPTNPLAHNNLGTVFLDLGLPDRAKEVLTKAVELRPEYPDGLANLGRALFDTGDLGSARQVTRAALAIDPRHVEALNGMSFLCAACGDLDGSLARLEEGRAVDSCNARIRSNILLRLLADDKSSAMDIRARAEEWGSAFAGKAPLTDRKVTRVKTVGFVSGDLRHHPVGLFVAPVIAHLAKTLNVYCYSNHVREDEVTQDIQTSGAKWRRIVRQDALTVARQIVADEVDILIDLSGHTGDNRLDVFSHRPAPIQVTWLGYSGTTGLPQMDFLLADNVLVPTGAEGAYTEMIVRLKDSFVCAPSTLAQPVRREAPRGHVLFGVFNNPAKFSETCYRMWAAILAQIPDSRVLFKYQYSGDRWIQRQTIGRFESLGIDPGRVTFSPYVPSSEHLGVVGSVDIALDTYPYSGATTTIDCLRAGVPVVTLEADRYSGRMSSSLLAALGVQDTVVKSEDEYVAMAVGLATDVDRLVALRNRIDNALSTCPLADTATFCEDFLKVLHSLPDLK